jgi:hypothetical protein
VSQRRRGGRSKTEEGRCGLPPKKGAGEGGCGGGRDGPGQATWHAARSGTGAGEPLRGGQPRRNGLGTWCGKVRWSGQGSSGSYLAAGFARHADGSANDEGGTTVARRNRTRSGGGSLKGRAHEEGTERGGGSVGFLLVRGPGEVPRRWPTVPKSRAGQGWRMATIGRCTGWLVASGCRRDSRRLEQRPVAAIGEKGCGGLTGGAATCERGRGYRGHAGCGNALKGRVLRAWPDMK